MYEKKSRKVSDLRSLKALMLHISEHVGFVIYHSRGVPLQIIISSLHLSKNNWDQFSPSPLHNAQSIACKDEASTKRASFGIQLYL